MKKIILISLAGLVMGFNIPQFAVASPDARTKSDIKLLQKESKFEEIEVSALPEAVTKAISKDFPAYSVDMAFKGSDGSYKVNVHKGEKSLHLFYTKDGKLTKSE